MSAPSTPDPTESETTNREQPAPGEVGEQPVEPVSAAEAVDTEAAAPAQPPPDAAATEPAMTEAPGEVPEPVTSQPAAEPGDAEAGGRKRKKKRKKPKGAAEPKADEGAAGTATPTAAKPQAADIGAIVRRIGTTNEQALAYVEHPDPQLSRMSRKLREAALPDLPPVTAGALLGPAGLARHLVASAATGRYRDLFTLWELFRRFPEDSKPILAERQEALGKARKKLRTAVVLGLLGRAERVAEDISRAEGLIWQWLREPLAEHLKLVGARPAIASALLEREPDLDIPLPTHPDERWLAEAAAARTAQPLAEPVEAVLAANVHRLPATVETLRLATLHYPDRVEALVDRVDLDAPDVGAFLAWARDHGAADRLYARVRDRVSAAAARDRAKGLELWFSWQQRGVDVKLPDALRTRSLEGFDLSRPETAKLAALIEADGVKLDLQNKLDELAAQNRQLAEKAYEAMVCADLDVTLPAALEDNPIVKEGTRCPNCRAWTWVRPGHEQRCPRPPGSVPEPEPDPFDLAAAEVARTEGS